MRWGEVKGLCPASPLCAGGRSGEGGGGEMVDYGFAPGVWAD